MKVPANANPVDGVLSFDAIVDREINLLTRIYHPAKGEECLVNILELKKPVSFEVVPVIIFFQGGSFAHSSSNSAIYDTLCRRLSGGNIVHHVALKAVEFGIEVFGNILLTPLFGVQERTKYLAGGVQLSYAKGLQKAGQVKLLFL
ncbi:unnamed protein product [Sphenostylis stenocarpa]|uniref:Uncharacterized protein n=1 Tax=Sphenostylis stenocarpa TaxID=92480 RepID=A0AA86T0G2_9FABA|nr:unnamed protein product [Sphenostylis stenocarpa]